MDKAQAEFGGEGVCKFKLRYFQSSILVGENLKLAGT